MELTTKDKEVLKILVQRELEEIKEESGELMISNSPYFNQFSGDDSDLDFLKNETKYQNFLEELLKKL